MAEKKRICIIGPGAVGGVTAAILAREGNDVHLVAKYPELAGAITETGMEVTGYCGNFTQPVPSVARISELEGIFDYVLIATKADSLIQVAKEMLPFLSDGSRVVSMQNGICEEMLADIVGEERTIGCVVGWGGTMHEPGRVEMTSGGEFILGNWGREPDEQLERLAGILSYVVPTEVSGHIISDLYSKLIINSCITTLGAICGLYLGEMLARKHVRNLFIAIIAEAIRVADAMKLKVTPAAGGKLDYYEFLASGFMSDFKRHLTIRMIGMKYRKLKSSSLQSLERGRKTEVDNYNGYISAKGKEFGVQTLVNDQLTQLVREIEEGKRKISLENFREIKT